MNEHDNLLFPDSLEKLLETADYLGLYLKGSSLTLDSGFDDEDNRVIIRYYGLSPCIKPNLRRTKDQKKIYARLDDFRAETYRERYKVERTFAWNGFYRKLAIRYEKRQFTFLGFRYLAYSMINLRSFLNKNLC